VSVCKNTAFTSKITVRATCYTYTKLRKTLQREPFCRAEKALFSAGPLPRTLLGS